MRLEPCYSSREIAQAAGVSEQQVLAALGVPAGVRRGGARHYVTHGDAVRIGRALSQSQKSPTAPAAAAGPFSIFTSGRSPRPTGLPLALSSTMHAGLFVAAVFLTTVGLSPAATVANTRFDAMPLVFVALPGGGGGGGGFAKPPRHGPSVKAPARSAVRFPCRIPKPVEAVRDP